MWEGRLKNSVVLLFDAVRRCSSRCVAGQPLDFRLEAHDSAFVQCELGFDVFDSELSFAMPVSK